MPHSLRAAAYGPEFEQLLLTAHETCTGGVVRTFTLELESVSNAYSMRARTYAYFKALRQDADRTDLVELSEKMSLAVEGNNLIFGLREDSWGAKVIRKALKLPDNFDEWGLAKPGAVKLTSAGQTSLTEKLAEIRRKKAAADEPSSSNKA
jgi:hypothetical protein